jgi:curved DNA-binding protein CbpA
MTDHYKVLEVKPDATQEEVRNAYRRLARKLHPDVNPDPAALEQFYEVKEAYDVLGNPERRAKYDEIHRLHAGLEAQRERAKRRAEHEAKQREEFFKGAQSSERRTEAERERERLREERARARAREQTAAKVDPSEVLQMTTALNRGKLAEAERLAKLILAKDRRHALSHAVVGDVYRSRGDLKKAAQNYALAAQFDPRNPQYEKKHFQMLDALSSEERTETVKKERVKQNQGALYVGGAVVLVLGMYLALSREPALLPNSAWFSEITLGQLGAWAVTGVAVGAALALGGYLARFDASQGAAVMKVPPSVALAIIALLNFWLAAGLYIAVGSTQDAFNRSLSALLGSVAGTTGLLAFFVWFQGPAAAVQALVWGGNVLYLSALFGWFVSDSVRAVSPGK